MEYFPESRTPRVLRMQDTTTICSYKAILAIPRNFSPKSTLGLKGSLSRIVKNRVLFVIHKKLFFSKHKWNRDKGEIGGGVYTRITSASATLESTEFD